MCLYNKLVQLELRLNSDILVPSFFPVGVPGCLVEVGSLNLKLAPSLKAVKLGRSSLIKRLADLGALPLSHLIPKRYLAS